MTEPYRLDMRLEVDNFNLDDLAEIINRTKIDGHLDITAIVMRRAQFRHLAREAKRDVGTFSIQETLSMSAVFGVTIVQEEDGLTPRERSVQRMLRDEFPLTREEQVAEALEAERRLNRAPHDVWRVPTPSGF